MSYLYFKNIVDLSGSRFTLAIMINHLIVTNLCRTLRAKDYEASVIEIPHLKEEVMLAAEILAPSLVSAPECLRLSIARELIVNDICFVYGGKVYTRQEAFTTEDVEGGNFQAAIKQEDGTFALVSGVEAFGMCGKTPYACRGALRQTLALITVGADVNVISFFCKAAVKFGWACKL